MLVRRPLLTHSRRAPVPQARRPPRWHPSPQSHRRQLQEASKARPSNYFWSTVDPRVRHDPLPDPEPLVIQADDRRIALKLRGHSAHEAGIGLAVHAPPVGTAAPNVYGTDLAVVRFLASARHLALLAESTARR
jgi:hypothetical protein